jgi:Mg-chelatase subunit ChlD
MKKPVLLAAIFGACSLFMFPDTARAQPGRSSQSIKPLPHRAQVEIAFVVDTTGSMGGLIAGAKQKIWSIVNEIASAKPTPLVKIGFVAYRDIGDVYVTQVHPLNDDLDAAFATLQTFEAGGGGDSPEHVSKGLHEGVNSLQWSRPGSGASTYQVLFLVGDCPPHADYDDGFNYRNTARQASNKGLVVNTIRCGSDTETQKVWQEIARIGGGEYFSIAQNGGVTTISTPYDAELSRVADAIEGTTVARNSSRIRALESRTANAALPAASKADRASFNSKSAQVYGSWDLSTQYAANELDVKTLKTEDLPPEMQKLTPSQRAKYLQGKVEERKKAQSRLDVLQKQRNAYIQQQMASTRTNDKDAFDVLVKKTVKSQAARRGLKFDSL